MASNQQQNPNGSQWSNSPPPIQTDPWVKLAARIYVFKSMAPAFAILLLVAFTYWFFTRP